jgi:hypothetical protein
LEALVFGWAIRYSGPIMQAYNWHPPVGVYIAVLALLAVLVPIFRAKMSRCEKAIWTAVMFSLMLLEMKSIYQDRAAHDKEQAVARATELEGFKKIAAGINTSISSSQQQFAATMSRFDDNVNTMTGGNSYCYFTFNFDGTPKLLHRGKYTLYDLRFNFVDAKQSFIVGTEWLIGSPITVGDFSAGSSRLITGIQMPQGSAGRLDLRIFFGARNGFWYERYLGLYSSGKWVEAIKVTKQGRSNSFLGGTVLLKKIDKGFPWDKDTRRSWN